MYRTPTVKSYVEEKLGKSVQKHSHLVTLFTNKHGVVPAEEDAESVYGSIDLVSSIIQRKLRGIKEKDSDHGRHMKGLDRLKVREPKLAVAEDIEGVSDEQEDYMIGEIIRTKYFDMRPLTVAEAIEQLENQDHDFYGFRNEETGEVNIAYRRKAGGYELIIPKGNGEMQKLEPILLDSASN
ncbi:hypothetical protein BUALT_Bualt06G0137600 [Buddleja alternifolia]|uniref:Sigma 54 modulation/S30EA ribosomal protein C-terminal domain-containing protein n=1 Tax=Buddleja alternifolia TaxID=168488 RepID=A0AAV6XR50_9LAMI|nr:hypothetical protein BUALT_Bualt06G0137600 [Buddleja alternifolia]